MKTLVAAHEEEPCLFAIRSGGHTPWAGASSIDDGITIDLSALNQVTYDAQASQASVGSGARWEAVYAALDPLGVAIPGGRAGTVGVGGLTLGGKVGALAWTMESHQRQGETRSSPLGMGLSATMSPTSR